MSLYDASGSASCTLELNAQLEHAELQLLSAHCAAHQLRTHYSADELAIFGRRDILRKSARAASDLHNFYSSIEKKIPQDPNVASNRELTPAQLAQSIQWFCGYYRRQRDHYSPIAGPLSPGLKDRVRAYFSPQLLNDVRLLELHGSRISSPEFFNHVRSWGIEPPEISHMDSVTFIDVIAFNQELTERAFFHALVHAVQIRALGLEAYAERWVHSFLQSRVFYSVPLEIHAFSLASRFLRAGDHFSVEEQVFQWIADRRY